MRKDQVNELINECIDMLDAALSEDEIHRTFYVNQIRGKLWKIRDILHEDSKEVKYGKGDMPDLRVLPDRP